MPEGSTRLMFLQSAKPLWGHCRLGCNTRALLLRDTDNH